MLTKLVWTLLSLICSLRGVHQFRLPPGDPETTNVTLDKLHCRVCRCPFLVAIAEMNDVSLEQAERYFTSPILHPPKVDASSKDAL